MKQPKTLKAYLSILRMIENVPLSSLKGWNNLNDDDLHIIENMSADISNYLNELETI